MLLLIINSTFYGYSINLRESYHSCIQRDFTSKNSLFDISQNFYFNKSLSCFRKKHFLYLQQKFNIADQVKCKVFRVCYRLHVSPLDTNRRGYDYNTSQKRSLSLYQTTKFLT